MPIAGERTPPSPWEGRSSATTRRCLLPHVTPSQLQNSPVLLLFQEARASPLTSARTAAVLKASSAASSSATSVEMETEADAISNSGKLAERVTMPAGCFGMLVVVAWQVKWWQLMLQTLYWVWSITCCRDFWVAFSHRNPLLIDFESLPSAKRGMICAVDVWKMALRG